MSQPKDFLPSLPPDQDRAGKEKPGSPQEAVELGQLCGSLREQYRATVRFYADAFKDDPKLANNLQANHRYKAASYAVLAAAGKGKDAPGAERERAALRRLALDWLRGNLQANGDLLNKVKGNRPVVRQRLASWLQDTNLATVREDKAVTALPEAERKEWQQLWSDVKELRKTTDGGRDLSSATLPKDSLFSSPRPCTQGRGWG